MPPRLNRPRKIILTTGIGILLILGGLAFIAQATRFPETTFEALLFWMGISGAYMLIQYNLWR
ncbi:hypothetical protein [Dawidia cretensis]|uniref:hypothetical protein n=1 Tax=Dawidia cretensis TaxID=2782350 RepID=UPI0020B1B8FA|nr:hypothetical protein [Dawidia cretensis]